MTFLFAFLSTSCADEPDVTEIKGKLQQRIGTIDVIPMQEVDSKRYQVTIGQLNFYAETPPRFTRRYNLILNTPTEAVIESIAAKSAYNPGPFL